MTFAAPSTIPVPSLSVHSAERLSTNTDRTMFTLVSEEGTTTVVMNLLALDHAWEVPQDQHDINWTFIPGRH